MCIRDSYDTFSKQYGLINSRANISAFSQDSSFSLLSALEVLGDEGQLERKADTVSYTHLDVYKRQVVKIAANDGKAIENELIYGSVSGKKVDENGSALGGALIGSFRTSDGGFTKENALMTTVSAEDGVITDLSLFIFHRNHRP